MEILIVKESVSPEIVQQLADAWHGVMVKGVADVERGVVALGGEWHMDANALLLADGSVQQNLWGFNIYPDERGAGALEYISLINIRPQQGNREMELHDEELRTQITELVREFIPHLEI